MIIYTNYESYLHDYEAGMSISQSPLKRRTYFISGCMDALERKERHDAILLVASYRE